MSDRTSNDNPIESWRLLPEALMIDRIFEISHAIDESIGALTVVNPEDAVRGFAYSQLRDDHHEAENLPRDTPLHFLNPQRILFSEPTNDRERFVGRTKTRLALHYTASTHMTAPELTNMASNVGRRVAECTAAFVAHHADVSRTFRVYLYDWFTTTNVENRNLFNVRVIWNVAL